VELLADIRAMLAAREDIEPDTFRVHFNNFGPSSLDILVHAYALTRQWADWLVIQESVYLEIMRLVEAHGASFAFPSQSLYIETPIPQASPPEGKED
jgi:MscS family membrane protein